MPELAIFGLGELGKLYGAGALSAGFRVTPLLRNTPLNAVWTELPARTPLLIAVSEASLRSVLDSLPANRRGDAILLQNEIFPSLWSAEREAPTVMIPWLLKKRGLPQIVIRPTPVYGRHAEVAVALHGALGLPCVVLGDAGELARELAHKYAFILTINALGVWMDRTLGDWLAQDPERVRALTGEASTLAARLAEVSLDMNASVEAVLQGMRVMSSVSARGRSATTRLVRAQSEAKRLHLALPVLEGIATEA